MSTASVRKATWASSLWMVLCLGIVCCALQASSSAASSVTIPDDYTVIQSAIDARIDTIYVRSVQIREDIVLTETVVLRGLDGPVVPEIGQVYIQPSNDQPHGKYFEIGALAIRGGIVANNRSDASRILLQHCTVDGGLADISDRTETVSIVLRGCDIRDSVALFARSSAIVESCVVRGHLRAGSADLALLVKNSQFYGDGSGTAISDAGYEAIRNATILHNTIDGYVRGMILRIDIVGRVADNTIQNCTVSGIDLSDGDVTVEDNRINGCGTGIVVDS